MLTGGILVSYVIIPRREEDTLVVAKEPVKVEGPGLRSRIEQLGGLGFLKEVVAIVGSVLNRPSHNRLFGCREACGRQ